MIFADLIFIYIFLPLCLICYFAAQNPNVKNVILVLFSLAFYAWGEPLWVLLLIFSAFVDYCNGRFIGKFRGRKIAVLGLISSLVINLGILATFKYSGFIVENINAVFRSNIPVPNFTLPIGISFYTFQTISYTVDVYRDNVKPQKSFLRYLMYISMFFQLVAGPIVRYVDVAKEIDKRSVTISDFNAGITRFVYGLGKKVLIANAVGELADKYLIFTDEPNSLFAAWFGLIMFTLQIYYDFSGYSDMAIGLGAMFGFHFPENFNYPYISRSATEFWRRWHISLGSFFRDYLYIPMGGNRKHQLLNLAVVWFLTGLWHGASWNFILWGCYFGVLIILEKFIYGKSLDKIKPLGFIYMFFVTVIGWGLFYFTDLSKFGKCVAAMFGGGGVPLIDELSKADMLNNLFLIIFAVIFSFPVFRIIREKIQTMQEKSETAIVVFSSLRTVCLILILAASTVMLISTKSNPFLYFNF